MRTKTRLILQFSLLFAALLTLVLSIIYYLVDKEIKENFYKRLEDRAMIVGHTYLASDNFTKEEYQEVLKKFPRTLPTERIRIYDMNYNPMFIEEGDVVWDKPTIKRIITHNVLFFNRHGEQVVGILYKDNSGDFVIIASAQNVYGEQSLQELLYAMLISFILAIGITIVLGNVFSNWVLSAINSIISHMQRVEASRLNERLPLRNVKHDEIETLKETINQVFERLQQTFESQQSFVSNASHELKTPIAVLMGNAEITIRKERPNEEYVDTLQRIIKDCQKMDNLINNLLDLAQVDFQMLKTRLFTFEDFFWDTMDDLMAEYPEIKIAMHINAELGMHDVHLEGNPNLLKIALTNIIHNGAKFSNFKEIDINIIIREKEIAIEVADKGIGIHEKEIHKILTPFYRGKNALKHTGSGLGLSMSQKIISLHKGQLHIRSKVGQGTFIQVKLNRYS